MLAAVPVSRQRRDWEELGQLDPLWAIASSPEKRFGKWELEEFFVTGEREVAELMTRAEELGLPQRRASAMDFGCGVGRATRALAERFEHVVGVDISEAMLIRGRELHDAFPTIEFLHNDAEHLRVVGDRRFDLVYTRLVLQHQPSVAAVRSYIEEFVRVLAPGGAVVFQVPDRLPLRYRLLVARRAYLALRRLGVPSRLLYKRLRLHPIRMLWVAEEDVRSWVEAAGARLVAVDRKTAPTGVRHATFFVQAPVASSIGTE